MNLKQLTKLGNNAYAACGENQDATQGECEAAATLAIWKAACEAQREESAMVGEKYADDLPNFTTEQTAMRGAVRYAADAIRNAPLAEPDKESTT